MINWRNILKRSALSILLAGLAVSNSGCTLVGGFLGTAFHLAGFWETTPLIPVTPYWTQKIEDRYWEEERYEKVPILDPVEGENAPIFCLDHPSADEVMRALPDNTEGGVWFLTETARNNVRMTIDPIVDRLDDCRYYPMVGPARLHHCHYKCTVFFDETIRSTWPIPFSHTEAVEEVVYIDHDHLIRCAGPASE
ncbi:MAG: hypothetical protein KDA78_05080 [Planctomycetaceae bacterium]|nr:hypothetical protein [Planctomycetaceae bacterium]